MSNTATGSLPLRRNATGSSLCRGAPLQVFMLGVEIPLVYRQPAFSGQVTSHPSPLPLPTPAASFPQKVALLGCRAFLLNLRVKSSRGYYCLACPSSEYFVVGGNVGHLFARPSSCAVPVYPTPACVASLRPPPPNPPFVSLSSAGSSRDPSVDVPGHWGSLAESAQLAISDSRKSGRAVNPWFVPQTLSPSNIVPIREAAKKRSRTASNPPSVLSRGLHDPPKTSTR